MGHSISRLTVVASVLLAAGSSAMADMTVTLTNGYGHGPGGEFNATPSGFDFVPVSLDFSTESFEVFCVERTEHIRFNREYHVVINTEAVDGGGGPNPDPLDSRTAYLYEQFITGQLDGYEYTPGDDRRDSADALQNVIWYLEEELSWNSNWDSDSLEYAFLQDAIDNHTGDIGTVRIMNLYGDAAHTVGKQDQLVMLPTPIPAPGAAVLAVVGFGVLRLRRKRHGGDLPTPEA